MLALLRSAPADELADRYPGRPVGTIGDAALPSPDSLISWSGARAAELSRTADAVQVTSIATRSPGDCPHCRMGTNTNGIDLVLGVTAVALIFPVLVLIGTAARLSAVRREQRFAAMRLVGATPRQISVVAAVESTVAAVAGTLAGFALFAALRAPLSTVPLTGEPFFPSDLSLTPVDVLVVALGVPVAACVAAQLAIRRVRISPLGVSRRTTPRPPRAYRLLPLARRRGRAALVPRPPTPTPRRPALGLPRRDLRDHGRPRDRRPVADHGRRAGAGARERAGRPACSRRGASPTTRAAASARSAGSCSPCSSPAPRSP